MSRAPIPGGPTSAERRARVAVALLFLTNGAIFANILPRYPEIKAELALSNTVFGLAVAAFPAGALVAGLAAGALIRRFRSSRVAVAGTVATSLALLLAGSGGSLAAFAGALFLAGAADAVTDVAQNAHGLRVQRRYGRSILNSFHAIWSIGAVTGGLMSAAAIALGLPVPLHLTISSAVFIAVALTASRFLLRGPDHGTGAALPDTEASELLEEHAAAGAPAAVGRPSARTIGMLLALVLIAMGGAVMEDAGNSWAALYLSGTLGAAASVAAFGFIALVGAQFLGRLAADRLVDRFGQRAVARAGGAIAAIGMGAALLFPSVPLTIVGFALTGLGTASLIPAAMQTADELPGLRPGTGLTLVSWLLRLGFLAGPPVVGLVADARGLGAGLAIVPIAGVAVVLLASVLSGRPTPRR